MENLIHADIFFFITTIAVMLLTAEIAVARPEPGPLRGVLRLQRRDHARDARPVAACHLDGGLGRGDWIHVFPGGGTLADH